MAAPGSSLQVGTITPEPLPSPSAAPRREDHNSMTFSSHSRSDKSNSFAAKLWAKEKIDDIERTIDIDGATDSLKALDINLSLQYRIRCMYTAYIADKTNRVAEVEEDGVDPWLHRFGCLRWGDANVGSVTGPSMIREINLYRSETPTGPFVKMNSTPLQGNSYLDHAPRSIAWYEIEIVTTNGRHIRSTPVSSNGDKLPTTTALLQNYPNPFNPKTGIRVQVSGDRDIRLVVYDLLGREVAVLANGRYPAGEYTFTFDGTNLASGIYHYRLTAGAFSAVRSMCTVNQPATKISQSQSLKVPESPTTPIPLPLSGTGKVGVKLTTRGSYEKTSPGVLPCCAPRHDG